MPRRSKTTDLRTQTDRKDRPVAECHSTSSQMSVHRPIDFVGWGRWVHRFDSRLQLYDSDLMVASLYCWEEETFPTRLC